MSDKTAADLPTRPLRADARRNRELLMATARNLFSEGQLELRMDEVARRAGVGIGTLYRHFETREALVAAVYQQEIERLCASADDLLATLPADEALFAFLVQLTEYAANNRGLATALNAGLGRQAASESFTGSSFTGPSLPGPRRLMETVTMLLHAAVKSGRLRSDVDPAAVMIVVGSLCTSYDHPGWKQQAQAVVKLLLDGLRYGMNNQG